MGKNVVVVGAGGVEQVIPEEDAKLLGRQAQDPGIAEAQQFGESRRKMFDTIGDKVSTIARGAVDAVSIGLLRDRSEEADISRDVNAGSEFIGQALGVVGGMAAGTGPVSWLTRGGEAVGKAAAKTLLRRAETSFVTRAMAEGGANMALAAATATNHALMDTVLADKPFAAESILDESALAGVLGVAAGGIIGSLSKLKGASRAKVAGQDKFLGNIDDALTHVDEVHGAYSDALRKHGATYGAIKELRKQGKLTELSDDFMFVRKEALRKARIAERGMKSADTKAAMSGADPAAYKRFQTWRAKYMDAMAVLDDVMSPAAVERVAADAAAPLTTPTKVTIDRGISFVDDAAHGPEVLDAEVALADAQDALATADIARFPDAEAPLKADVEAASARVKGAKETAKSTLKTSDQAGKYVDNPEGQEAAIERMFKKPGTKGEKAKAAEEWFRNQPTRVADPQAGDFVTPEPVVPEVIERGDLDALNAAVAKLPVRTSAENGAAMSQFLDQVPLEAGPKEALLRQMMDDWFQQPTGAARPTAQAAAAAQESFERLYAKTGGRMDSARATNVLESDGILPSSDTHGAYFDGIYSMNRASKLAADESRGVATSLSQELKDAMAGAIGAMAFGPAGLLLPAVLKRFAPGLTGKLAGAASALALRTAEAVSKFVTSTSTRTVIQAANNTAWTYSDKGPIKDPVERIQEIQFLAANPEAIRERVREGAGELAAMSPDLVAELEERTIQQITGLAMSAPAILYDKLGRAIAPPQGKLRQFFEYENVTNNLDIYLKALASGSLTRPQIMAGKVCWPQVNMKVAAAFIADPDLLQKLERHKLSVIESVTGLPLTNANDPQFIIRQQMAWMAQQQQQAAQAPQKPQAFNINPSGSPTPSQAGSSGVAPGNQ